MAFLLLLSQATSSLGTSTALAVLVLERLIDALEAMEAAIPLYLRKRRLQSQSKASSLSTLTQMFFGATTSNAGASNSGNDDDKRPQLQALVLTKNREIAASVTVRQDRERTNSGLPQRFVLCFCFCSTDRRREGKAKSTEFPKFCFRLFL